MRKRQIWWITFLFGVILLWSARPASAQGETDSWQMKTDLRIWGFDLAWSRKGSPLFSGVDTGYFCSVGGGLQTFGFYRLSDETPYAPPRDGKNRALYKDANLTWSMGLKQGLGYDQVRERNLWELVFSYHGRYDHHLVDETPDALLFTAALPDRNGGFYNALFTGILYNGVEFDPVRLLKKGVNAELSWELAPLGFFNSETGADYKRINGTLLGFYPLYAGEEISIYLAERFMYDHLSGDYIPIRARTSFGGFSKYPGFTNGLGGGLRGVEAGRYDGYVKALNNLEVRFIYPGWVEYGVVPEAIIYFDLGVTDNLTSRLDHDQVLRSAGIGVGASDLLVYANYFFNEDLFTLELALGIHF